MAFFEVPPPPPREPEPEYVPPPWYAPPREVVGAAVVAPPLVLATTTRIGIAVTGLLAYPTGLGLTVVTIGRGSEFDYDFPTEHRNYGRHGLLTDQFLRFGVEFSDGRRANNVEVHSFCDEKEPAKPVLQSRGGGGGAADWHQDYWLWPLPPPGPMMFVCEWPSEGIPETRAELDANLIIAASAEGLSIWPGA